MTPISVQPLRAEKSLENRLHRRSGPEFKQWKRKFPDQPMRPGKRERQEFEYTRHGTQTLIASFDVVSGQVVKASVGNTRYCCQII